jgi:hydrogenase nickel incorporation protein HypA/HybF
MHELSIAVNLVELAVAAADEAGVSQVLAVRLRLGALAGVVPEALSLGYEVAAQGTVLAGSRLIIEPVPVVIYCPACAAPATLTGIQQFVCPRCGTPTADIRQGKEIELVALEAAEDDV